MYDGVDSKTELELELEISVWRMNGWMDGWWKSATCISVDLLFISSSTQRVEL